MKNIFSIAATLGAAALLAGGAPALVRAADMPAGPIQIESAQVYGQNTESEDGAGTVPSQVRIAYTNTSDQPATSVTFALVTDGAVMDTITDAGTFTKGATIDHYFTDTYPSDTQNFAVQSVTFADGSMWNNPDVPGAPADTENASVSATDDF